MLQKYNEYKIIKLFLYSPTESYRWREICQLTKISPVSAMNYIKEFIKQGVLRTFEKRGIKFYQADRDSEKFKLYSKLSIMYELNQSGIIDYIWKEINPLAIILFGSYSRGEAIEESDIDIFIVGKERKLDYSRFELGSKISVKFELYPKKIPQELKSNLINGIVLKGYFNAL